MTGELLNNNTEEKMRAGGSGSARGWLDGEKIIKDDKRWRGRQALLAMKEKGITLLKLS